MKNKIIYLTIDDCPSKNFKEKLDFLIKNKIKAILFCIGKRMEKKPKDIIYAIKKGFIIGNHSYSHPHFSLISVKEAERQIKLTDEIINSLYKKAGKRRKFKVFRFPYNDPGNIINRNLIQKILKKYSYKRPKFKRIKYKWYNYYFSDRIDVFWTYDFAEYKIKSIRIFIKKILKNRGNLQNKKTNDILLIHDNKRTTKLFYKIINKLIEQKVKFVIPKK